MDRLELVSAIQQGKEEIAPLLPPVHKAALQVELFRPLAFPVLHHQLIVILDLPAAGQIGGETDTEAKVIPTLLQGLV